ncbi:MAG: hypothetical protein IKT99_01365 [Oscillospiraceae bacterium]|nr:hypothetical protein [Oscillospiraceae bacterium]
MLEKAYFIFLPRTAADLSIDNPAGKWKKYRIVKTICLSQIDFENFETDLLADRQFIEDNAALCAEPGGCLLVTTRRKQQEYLILPWNGGFVHYAALRPRIRVLSDQALSH